MYYCFVLLLTISDPSIFQNIAKKGFGLIKLAKLFENTCTFG